MTTRTDAHSPTNLITEDYDYVFAADLGSSWARGFSKSDEGLAFLRSLSNLDPATEDRGFDQCHHCGAHLRYAAWLRHEPTGYLIVVGETCLDNRFGRATADFQALRRAAQLDREAQRLLTAYNAFIGSLDGVARLLLCSDADAASVDETVAAVRADSFVADVRRRTRQYGSASEKQVAAVVGAFDRAIERQARLAVEAEEITIPVPTGRYQISGEIVSLKWQESDYGSTLKMLVKVDTLDGTFKVWGSVPSGIEAERGARVTFTATVERSSKDESFGFFKRPAKAVLVAA